MVVCDLDAICTAITPAKADTPLIIRADAVLSLASARQLFQAITRRDTKIVMNVQDA